MNVNKKRFPIENLCVDNQIVGIEEALRQKDEWNY